MRLIVIGLLIAIVVSLASALVFIFRDQGSEAQNKHRAVRALSVRVALSITVFLILMGGKYFGLIGQHL